MNPLALIIIFRRNSGRCFGSLLFQIEKLLHIFLSIFKRATVSFQIYCIILCKFREFSMMLSPISHIFQEVLFLILSFVVVLHYFLNLGLPQLLAENRTGNHLPVMQSVFLSLLLSLAILILEVHMREPINWSLTLYKVLCKFLVYRILSIFVLIKQING